jgi:hypothetical protein
MDEISINYSGGLVGKFRNKKEKGANLKEVTSFSSICIFFSSVAMHVHFPSMLKLYLENIYNRGLYKEDECGNIKPSPPP